MRNTLLAMTLVYCAVAQAQDYAVNLKNDTLRGDMKILSYDAIDWIQVNDGTKKRQLKAIEVRSVFFNKEVYHPIRSDDGYRMMKLEKPGYLSLYLARRKNGYAYEVQYLVKKSGATLEVPNLYFRKIMTDFLNDCASMSEKMKEADLGRRNLDIIITEYNACIEKQTNTTKPASAVKSDDARLVALGALASKLEQEQTTNKKDALEILKDLSNKVKGNEPVPNYLLESLKESLKNTPGVETELGNVLALLKAK